MFTLRSIIFTCFLALWSGRGWTSDLINQQIDEHLASLEAPHPAAVTEWTDKLRAAVHEFDNYQVLLGQLNRQEMDDQQIEHGGNRHPFGLLEDQR